MSEIVSGLDVYRKSSVRHQLILKKKSIAELVQHFFQ